MKTDQQLIAEVLEDYIREYRSELDGYGAFENNMVNLDKGRVNVFDRPIEAAPSVKGRLISVFKKVVRRAVGWYANPFAGQQVQVNSAAYNCLQYLGAETVRLRQENERLNARVEELAGRLDKVEQDGEGRIR